MSDTCHIGPLGSEFWRIRVPPEAIPELAREIDWNRLGRRVVIDPVGGLIAWMHPAGPHERYALGVEEVVRNAGRRLTGRIPLGMRGMRWRLPEDPPNSGMEADASFYIGDLADAWRRAFEEGGEAVSWFELATPPDLVVEVEVTHLDREKPARYARLGAREMWQVRARTGEAAAITILDLQAEGGPRELRESLVLPGLELALLAEATELARGMRIEEMEQLLGERLAPAPEPEARDDGRRALSDDDLLAIPDPLRPPDPWE